jgi:aconitate hydratase 2/2-methylisocitrate dehydratase
MGMIMNLYAAYLDEIESRKKQNLKPKPIDNGPMVEQLIKQILDKENQYRDESINFFTTI